MKKLGFWSIVLLAINSIIGSGIFLSPGAVIQKAGKYTLVVYAAAAIFAAVLAITFAAAAKYVNKSGASYAYATAAFGKNVGFYVGITRFVAASIAWGVIATAVVKTTLAIFGGNAQDFVSVTIGLLILMVILLLMNVTGNKVFAFFNNLATIGKLAALITTIIVGFIIVMMTGHSHFNDINQLVDVSQLNTSTFVMAVIAAFYAFVGFESVASGAEDMKAPEKNLPRAIPLAILIIAVIYISIIAVIMMINPTAVLTSKHVVSLVTVFESPIISNIILYGALISMVGISIAGSFSTPRILEAIANENQVPAWFKQRTKYDFPFNAFITTFLVALIIPMAFQYNMVSIIVLSSVSRFVQFIVVPIGVIMFYYNRERGEILPNVYKNKFTDVVLPVIGLVLTVILLVKFDWKGQFSIATPHHIEPNYFAIIAMVIGYVVLPLVLFIANQKRRHV
ncbi:amino acid permease [Staphylococcus simulans]|uniref:APC family permease n=1 Tax=Staphylococcus simulans TaxID=1286 RepID=UPI000D1F48B1|nr:APC family permease [Staphylococcus simulans]PTJ51797.1 amino acid permease [Staphylococcus simulans]